MERFLIVSVITEEHRSTKYSNDFVMYGRNWEWFRVGAISTMIVIQIVNGNVPLGLGQGDDALAQDGEHLRGGGVPSDWRGGES